MELLAQSLILSTKMKHDLQIPSLERATMRALGFLDSNDLISRFMMI
jgi:hypothetical protein